MRSKIAAMIGMTMLIGSVGPPAMPAGAADVALKLPVKAGISVTIVHGYNDPLPTQNCVIGVAPDHCNNQKYGFDLQVNSSDTAILAPMPGRIGWISGDCLGLYTEDGLNLNVCHFASRTVSQGQTVRRGDKLGDRSTSWIHLSLDTLPSNSARLPVAFNGAHTIEGRAFDPKADTEKNQYRYETLTSTNGQSAPAKPSNLSAAALSSSAIRFRWQDNAGNETSQVVFRWSGSAWQQIATVGANVTSYDDGGRQANTTYYYTVCAGNAISWSCADSYATGKTTGKTTQSEVIVDDRSGGFSKTGQYWWEAGIGYSAHMWWTYVNGSTVSSAGEWRADLAGGRYEVYTFIPRDNATSRSARYEVSHNGGTTVRVVDQSLYYDTWVSLGTYDFAGGSQRRVRLTDATGEAASSYRKLGFDAIKLTPR